MMVHGKHWEIKGIPGCLQYLPALAGLSSSCHIQHERLHPPLQILYRLQRWSALRLLLAEVCAGLLLAALSWLVAATQSQQPELHGLSQLRLYCQP